MDELISKKKRRLLIFENGYRSVGEEGTFLTNSLTSPFTEVDLTNATEEEFNKVRAKPHDEKFIKKIKDRIDSEAKNK